MISFADESPVVIVAGGTGGLGSAICERLAGDGWVVVSISRGLTSPGSVPTPNVQHIVCDVTSESACEALVSRVMQSYGRLDAMVYAAIGYHHGSPESHSAAVLSEVFAGNVYGAHLLSCACVRGAMKSAGMGAICLLGSLLGTLALPKRSAYCASKAALLGLCRALAVDWARHGIRVNCVTTAYAATELELAGAASGQWEHRLEDLERRIPLGRLVKPSEVAAAVAWVIGRESNCLTGSELVLDGGWSASAGMG